MKVPVRLFALLLIFGMNLPACHSGDGSSTAKKYTNSDKGANHTMKTYYMGRFSLGVPIEMKQAVQAHTLRYVDIEEFIWPKGENRDEARKAIWKGHVAGLRKLKLPKKVKSIVVDERDASVGEKWTKAVLYYGDYISNDTGYWDALVDIGEAGVWLKFNGLITGKQEMLKWIIEIASNLHSKSPHNQEKLSEKIFYLRHSVISLPYLEQEKTYSRFEGHPFDLKLEVEMNETHKVEKLGVAERLAASIATRFAPGVDVDKIRSRSRVAAGLKGEELVMRMSASGEDTQIQFGWEYRGEADSGERPEIQITMETADGNLNEKLKVWDAILDSFRPMYR